MKRWLGEPARGDIVTFSSPTDDTWLIKRIVALPGDIVAMQNEVLFINGKAAEYSVAKRVPEDVGNGIMVPAVRETESIAGSVRAVQFLARPGAERTFGPGVVPPGHYFMLGDNRDNSADSRVIGFVPRNSIIGRADRILLSVNITGNWLPGIERTIAPIH